ncbi:MAG: M23 family metallopeptidase [Anaerolineae bacterium]|nr:MAG: M23 family metallopeptidase [Anaerolineae bacterium]
MKYDPLTDNSPLEDDLTISLPSRPQASPPPEESQAVAEPSPELEEEPLGRIEQFWLQLREAGLLQPALRVATLVLSLVPVLALVLIMRALNVTTVLTEASNPARNALAAAPPTPAAENTLETLPPLITAEMTASSGVYRRINAKTIIPTRPRVDVITYTVQPGDSVFGIAEQFGLRPETILWANSETLRDDPHRLQVGQVLNILPVDGTYHKWSEGENLRSVAEYYGVEPEAILQYPGNHFDLFDQDPDNVNIEPGTMLIVPGGKRELINYGPPRIPRDNPAVARTYGPGYCGEISDGIVGDGLFVWPTDNHWLSGYDYNPAANHSGIDIGGKRGDSIYAVDDGVVVFAGWSSSGYGNLVVIDHGNDWQSLYAHLDNYFVSCGMSIYQGAVIGTMGTTGNSSGPHLHFELHYGTSRVNPWNFLP